MAQKICTPFCIKGKPYLKYHDLLVAILEFPHIRDKRGKMDEFEETVIFSKERLEDRRRNP